MPVSSELSDFTPCTHAQSNILHTKYVDKTDYKFIHPQFIHPQNQLQMH